MRTINVKFSKRKMILGTILSLIFFSVSVYALIAPAKLLSFWFRSSEFIWIFGAITLIFSSISLYYFGKRLLRSTIALKVNNEGITDNTNGSSIGFIPWNEIVTIKKIRSTSTDFLLIEVRHPDKYIAQSTNFLQERMMKTNLKYYGTPITINSSTIDYDFNNLEQEINTIHGEWKINN